MGKKKGRIVIYLIHYFSINIYMGFVYNNDITYKGDLVNLNEINTYILSNISFFSLISQSCLLKFVFHHFYLMGGKYVFY